jgi:ribose 5-phosphate isomerase B
MSFDQDEIAGLVRQVVSRTLGRVGRRAILHEEAVRQMPVGSTQLVPAQTIITPLARQVAQEMQIELVEETVAGSRSQVASEVRKLVDARPQVDSRQRIIALGADHGGYELKEKLKEIVVDAGYGTMDCGTHSRESVDYPDFAYAVARLVADGRAWRGIIVDGAGIGSCMAANKVPGVRAAMCYDQATAVNSREHNNANILTLGAGLIGPNLAGQIVRTWLATNFGGGRHARRVDKIDAIGRRYSK